MPRYRPAMSDAIDNTDPASDLPCPVIAIGASAGGLEALQAFFSAAPIGHGAAYIVIQHLDPDHESLMGELLARRTEMKVSQAEDGIVPDADNIYLIPPGRSMTIEDGHLRLEDFPLPRGVRRPIDTFFLSLADDLERGFATIVLSGTGTDGSRAFRAAKEAGGLTLVQDPKTAKFDGMPVAAIDTGFADVILPPAEMAEKVNDYFDRLPPRREKDRGIEGILPEVLDVIRDTVGHDFTGYKPQTLIRRTRRRVQLTGADGPEAYLQRLRRDRGEAEALFAEMLINVTEFFRDDEVFKRLRDEVVPAIAARAQAGRPIRVWVPGCSSGEEAYSLAMLLEGALRARLEDEPSFRPPQVQIFASDIDEQMLTVARAARYPIDAIDSVPEPYRSRCIIAQEGGFVMAPIIRDMVRFSLHSVIKDPPFTKLDLVSCRNLLIYFGSDLQDHVLPMFHYALREDGVLLLGTSEGLGRHAHLFTSIDARGRIYQRTGLPGRMPPMLQRAGGHALFDPREGTAQHRASPQRTVGVAAQRVLDRYAPAYLVVDRVGQLTASSGRLTKYLEFPTGQTTSEVVSLARPGLRAPLRRVLKRMDDGEPRAAVNEIDISSEIGVQAVDLVGEALPDGQRLIVIRDAGELRARDEDAIETIPENTDDVEDELRHVRFRLRTTVEELEAANEELKSSNEEMMSMNEELQSANEELSTVNDELKIKIDEVASTNADLRNFLESSDIPTIILGSDLEVRIFTPRAREVFPLRDTDVGRSLSEVRTPLDDADMLVDAQAVLDGDTPIAREVSTRDGDRTYLMQVTPYKAHSGEVEGVILSYTEVTAMKEVQANLAAQKERLSLAMQAAHLGVWEFWPETGQVEMDRQTRTFFGLPEHGETSFAEVGPLIDDADFTTVQEALDRAIEETGEYEATFAVTRGDGSTLTLYGIGRVHRDDDGTVRIVGINRDVTAERAASERSELMVRELNHRVKNMLSVIASIIRTAGRRATDIDTFVKQCDSRIAALSTAHTLLVKSDWQGAGVCDLAASCLSIFDIADRVQMDCTSTPLPPMESQAVSLVLHELATNALKHGALSQTTGTVHLVIEDVLPTAEKPKRLRLIWKESGGPVVSEPTQQGFGTILLRDMIRHQHRGDTQFEWDPSGLRYSVEMDVDRSARAAQATRTVAAT